MSLVIDWGVIIGVMGIGFRLRVLGVRVGIR